MQADILLLLRPTVTEQSPIETELKLSIPPDSFARVAAHPALRGGTAQRTRRLYSIYFDTPDCELWRHGFALRVLRDGKQWIQALKGGGSDEAGLHRRIEIEHPVARPLPDLALFRQGEHAAILDAPDLDARIEPAFTTDFYRSLRVLTPAPNVLVEACLDRGKIQCGGETAPLCELELELKSGPPAALYDLALALLETLPLAVENRSKAERGHALRNPQAQAPARADTAQLDAGMTVSDAFATIVHAVLAHLQANESGLRSGTDSEYLHQMRVAVRRLRSAFAVFSPVLPPAAVEPFLAEMKWLSGTLGPARDWDVFVETSLPPVRAAYARHKGLDACAAEFERLRRFARQKAKRAVASARYQRLVLKLAAWLAHEGWRSEPDPALHGALMRPVRDYAEDVLEARYARVRKRGRKLAGRSASELHRLRIAVKKLRYAAHFFSTLYARAEADDLLDRLARLQDTLGAINDAATVQRLLDAAHPAPASHAVAEARGILLGWSRGRANALERELRRTWKSFRSGGTFW